MKIIRCTLSLIVMVLGMTTGAVANEKLTVFSGRKEPLIRPVIDLFEKTSNIKVTLKTGKSGALAHQILQELPKTTADVFIAKESGSLEFLRMKGGFDSYSSEATKNIPDSVKASDNTWIGVSGRSRAVIYNKDLVKDEDLPTHLEDLLDVKYKGKVAAVNSGNESLVAWVSGLRLAIGHAKTKELLQGLKDNDIQLIGKSHTQVRKSIARGEFPFGLINHYYYHLQRHDAEVDYRNVGIIYLDQDKGGRGEIVNVSGAGIVKNAPHRGNAEKFINFLASSEAQRLFAEVNFEYPLIAGVKAHPETLEALGCKEDADALKCIRMMPVVLDELGGALNDTLDLLDDVDWN
ncbi:MAG: iron(III) transport system substrate-binding protein [Lysobacterales bacterium]|jgi:iron(III) transport system substrate-binding protein